jgi:hypothetical protein
VPNFTFLLRICDNHNQKYDEKSSKQCYACIAWLWKCLDLLQVSLEWVLIGYIQFIMRSVFNLKRRTRETCKTRHLLILDRILSGDVITIKLAGGWEARVYCKNAKYKFAMANIIYKTTDKYFNYGKKGYRFCEIGLMLVCKVCTLLSSTKNSCSHSNDWNIFQRNSWAKSFFESGLPR